MSTRYVWGRYTIEYVEYTDYDYDYNSVSSGNTIKKIDWSGGAYIADKLVWNGKSFDLSGNIKYWDFYNTGAQEQIGEPRNVWLYIDLEIDGELLLRYQMEQG